MLFIIITIIIMITICYKKEKERIKCILKSVENKPENTKKKKKQRRNK